MTRQLIRSWHRIPDHGTLYSNTQKTMELDPRGVRQHWAYPGCGAGAGPMMLWPQGCTNPRLCCFNSFTRNQIPAHAGLTRAVALGQGSCIQSCKGWPMWAQFHANPCIMADPVYYAL